MSNTQSMFMHHQVKKYPEVAWFTKKKKKVGCAWFFSTPFSVFGYPDKTLFLVFDILLQVIHNIQYATKTI